MYNIINIMINFNDVNKTIVSLINNAEIEFKNSDSDSKKSYVLNQVEFMLNKDYETYKSMIESLIDVLIMIGNKELKLNVKRKKFSCLFGQKVKK